MEIKEILDAYTMQIENMKKLIGIVIEKKQVLVSAKHNLFDDVLRREELVVSQIQYSEKRRITLINTLLQSIFPGSNGRNHGRLSSMLAGKIDSQNLKKLQIHESELKKAIITINEINSQNLFLLQHVRNFIHETISNLLGGRKQILVDRKV